MKQSAFTKNIYKLPILLFLMVFFANNNLFAQCGTGGSQTGSTVTPCSGSPFSRTFSVQVGNYVLANVIQGIQYRADSAGSIIIRNANNLSQIIAQGNVSVPFTTNFTGQVRIYNCHQFWGIDVVVLNGGSNTVDNETEAGTNQWKEHYYSGENFNRYLGYNIALKSETFTEEFGAFNDDGCGFNVYSQGQIRITQRRRNFSSRYLMNSTKKGLYKVDIGIDDGARLFVNGTKVFDSWRLQGTTYYNNQLFNLTGNSSLRLDFYERGGGNRLVVRNFNRLIENTINGVQNLCEGDTPTQITGDNFTTLPSGYTKVGGTGFQWVYSTTSGGATTSITGATGQNFTPDLNSTPFNIPGTYYVYRKAILSHNNHRWDLNPQHNSTSYTTSNISNEVTITVNPLPNNIGSGFSAGNICEGEQGTLTFNGINTGSYPYTIKYINNTDSSVIYEQNITNSSAQTFNAPDLNTSSPSGTYNYTLLSITDANGCTLSEASSVSSSSSVFGKKAARIIIRENPSNILVMSVNSNTACIGVTAPVITFTNSDTKPIIVTYTVNGGTAQTIEVPKKIGTTNGSATVNVATTTAGTYTYNAIKVRYKSSPNCETNINLSQCIAVFPNNNIAPTVNSGTETPITVASPTTVTGFTIQYSFDDGANWGTNTPPTADNCAGYKIRTRYVLANACGTITAGSTISCAVSPATTRVIDTTAPTFSVPTTAISECVNNIIEANYNNTTNGDINNPPDYYEFTVNDVSLNISNLQDNCCTNTPTISWSISPTSNGIVISGTGQPSQNIGGNKFWLNISATNPKASYVQKTYTITYNVTDCNGNIATKTRNITIKPRPKID